MRQLVLSTFLTLDGVIQAPGGPEEDPTGGFSHGGWTVPHVDEHVGAFMAELMTPAVRPRAGPGNLRHLRRLLAPRR